MSFKKLENDLKEFNIPLNHLGIIMDGNGRWATKRNLPRSAGHKEGAFRIKDVINYALKYKISEITLYTFSTENWKRSKSEVSFLFSLVSNLFEKYIDELINNRVRVNIVGLEKNIPPKVWKTLKKAELMSKEGDLLKVNIAFNYGGTEDILHAVKSIAQKVEDGSISIDNIDAKTIEENLISKDVGPIDLLIRTSGEQRVSNFMPWQISYSEIYFIKVLWPDFSEEDFIDALEEYKRRNRRFGGV